MKRYHLILLGLFLSLSGFAEITMPKAVVLCLNKISMADDLRAKVCSGVRTKEEVDAVISCLNKISGSNEFRVDSCTGVRSLDEVSMVLSCLNQVYGYDKFRATSCSMLNKH